jgi:peptidoglycan/LPS O-acetylase OafA/YrhL
MFMGTHNLGQIPETALTATTPATVRSGIRSVEARLPAVDAARGLAASVVVIHHLDKLYPKVFELLLGRDTIPYSLLRFVADHNAEAVLLFFIISGFCIRATSWKYNFLKRADVIHYASRRAARIVPLYLFALGYTYGVGVALGQASGSSYSLKTLAGNILFLQTPEDSRGVWFVPFGDNGPLWSISFEIFYYLLFPIFILWETRVAVRFGNHTWLVMLIMSFASSAMALAINHVVPNPIMLFMTGYCIWWTGVCAEQVRRGTGRYVDTLAVLAGLAILIGAVLLVKSSATGKLISAGTMLAILWLILQGQPIFYWLSELAPLRLAIKVLAALGGFSYGLYLIHYPTLMLAKFVFAESVVGVIISVLASFALAAFAESLAGTLKRQMPSSGGIRPTSL